MSLSTDSKSNTSVSFKHSLGTALLFEHLPDIKFRHCVQGVLFAIFSNGEAFFYPISDQTKGHITSTSAKMLTQETPNKKPATNGANEPSKVSTPINDNNKYFVYDATLSINHESHRVFAFNFIFNEERQSLHPPRKILLSPNKRLLLLLGATSNQFATPATSSPSFLLVYQIVEDGSPDFFRLIFYDFSFNFVDVCFAPDSKHLLVIPSRFSSFVFMIALPFHPLYATAATPLNLKQKISGIGANIFNPSNGAPSSAGSKTKLINFEARRVGPLHIFGPAIGAFGQYITINRIAANPMISFSSLNNENNMKNSRTDSTDQQEDSESETDTNNISQFMFVTWNDDSHGEFCIWTVCLSNNSYQCYPRLVFPKIFDRLWLEDSDSPTQTILDMQFSSREPKLLSVVKRQNYPKKSDNGIGIQMINLLQLLNKSNYYQQTTNLHFSSLASQPELVDCNQVFWYQVSEVADKETILSVKWSNTLLLGTTHAAAVLIKEKGLFELVDYHYGSAFQSLYDDFVDECCNFVQVGRYHRFWITKSGGLRVMVVAPQTPSSHPEWCELFSPGKTEKYLINMRLLARRIGYFINPVEKDISTIEIYNRRSSHQKKDSNEQEGTTDPLDREYEGSVTTLCGIHMYRCWHCQRPLLKPLLCSRCRGVVYCSRLCQHNDWKTHCLKCGQ